MKKNSLFKWFMLLATLLLTSFSLSAQASENAYDYLEEHFNTLTLPGDVTYVGKTGRIRPLLDSVLKDFDYAFSYSVSDPSVLSIDEKGNWKVLKEGTVTISVMQYSSGASDPKFDEEFQKYGLTWYSDSSGLVPMVAPANIQKTITVRSADKVYNHLLNHVDMATLPSEEVLVGTTGRIRPSQDSVLKDFDYAFHYKVSDPSILSIDEKGNWKALKSGKVSVEVINQGMVQITPAFRDEFARHGLAWFYGSGDIVPAVYYSVTRDIVVMEQPAPPKVGLLELIGVSRLYHPQRGIHTYIKGDGERAALEKRGWRYEGTAWISGLTGNKPVYRLYSAKKDAYVYTLHTSEVERLKAAGWRYEGIAFQSSGTKPVYRFYNKRAGIHFYTANPAERDKLKSSTNYRYEGFAWYSE